MDKLRLPIGISDFKQIVNSECTFVDKTLLIKDVMEEMAGVMLFTRPRRFGKTLNLSMLRYFLKCNEAEEKNLFEHLAISEDTEFCKKHQGQYPVIFLSLKSVHASDYETAYDGLRSVMQDLYSEHRYLMDDTLYDDEKEFFNSILRKECSEFDIVNSIKRLCSYLHRKYKKNAIVLIDEYDTPIQDAYLEGYYTEMIKLMRGMFGETLKDNQYLEKAILTGITRVSQESMFSSLNNLQVYSVLRKKYGQYFGFTADEVKELSDKSEYDISLDSIKEWYNGYQIGEYTLYNPWSILSCLDNEGEIEPYWLNTGGTRLMESLLTNAKHSLREDFDLLLQGKAIEKPLSPNLVFPNLNKNEEPSIWTLLLYAGYLKVMSSESRGGRVTAQICVPNNEVMFIYNYIVEEWFKREGTLSYYNAFIRNLMDGEMDKFKRSIAEYLLQSGSYFDFNKHTPEHVFHSFMLGLVVGFKEHYFIKSNIENGLGRSDVLFLPKDDKHQGIVLEFKTAKDTKSLKKKAKEALKQITDKEYLEAFRERKTESVLAVGLAFCGKDVELESKRVKI